MRRSLALFGICVMAIPFAVLTAIGSSTAATGPERQADSAMALQGRLLVEMADKNGTARTLREPAEVRSGDRLIFLIRYRNTGDGRYDFVSPVPRGVHILPERGGAVTVSADDGQSWSQPGSRLSNDASGATATHVRLRLSRTIAPGEAGTVVYRGVLL
ncbi:MAG: hypothetical protein ABW169_01710 [Sphingobium sp.]